MRLSAFGGMTCREYTRRICAALERVLRPTSEAESSAHLRLFGQRSSSTSCLVSTLPLGSPTRRLRLRSRSIRWHLLRVSGSLNRRAVNSPIDLRAHIAHQMWNHGCRCVCSCCVGSCLCLPTQPVSFEAECDPRSVATEVRISDVS